MCLLDKQSAVLTNYTARYYNYNYKYTKLSYLTWIWIDYGLKLGLKDN